MRKPRPKRSIRSTLDAFDDRGRERAGVRLEVRGERCAREEPVAVGWAGLAGAGLAGEPVHPVRRQERQRVPALVPPLADAPAFEQHVLVARGGEMVAERQAGLPGADDQRVDVGRARRPGSPGAAVAGHASTPTCTGTPFVTMSKTAERAFARSTSSRSFSGGASPSTSNVTRICS